MDATRHRIGYFEYGHRNFLGYVDYLLIEKAYLIIHYYDVLAATKHRCGKIAI
jgi:hypothetical protein